MYKDWIIEGKDNKGIYLVKDLKLLKGKLKVTIRCIIVPTLKPNICLRMFSVAPLKPNEADIIASLFGDALVWYYRDEEGGKIFFWSKSLDKLRFSSLSELEEVIISRIETGTGKALSRGLSIEDFIEDGWLIDKEEWYCKARKSLKVNNKLVLIDIVIDKREKNQLIADVRIFGMSKDDKVKYKEFIEKIISGNYEVEIFPTEPVFFLRFLRKNIGLLKEETLIKEIYNFVIEMVRTK